VSSTNAGIQDCAPELNADRYQESRDTRGRISDLRQPDFVDIQEDDNRDYPE
jgi:hypothetical protein